MFHRSESKSESFHGKYDGIQTLLDAHVRVGTGSQDRDVLSSKQSQGETHSGHTRTRVSGVLGIIKPFSLGPINYKCT